MKKTLWIAIAGALVASVIAASAQEVLSANAVGYIKRSIPELGKLNAVAYPLNSMDTPTIMFTNTAVAAEMPNLSWVYFWDSTLQSWTPSQKSGKGIWSGEALTKVVLPGEMFFLQTPSGQATPVEVTITGEVPEDVTLQRAIPGSSNLGALGNPYPVDFTFLTSALASNAANGSWVYFWNPTAQSWSPSQKSGKGAWSGDALTKVVQAGEGFFLQDVAAGSTWTSTKPYTWP